MESLTRRMLRWLVVLAICCGSEAFANEVSDVVATNSMAGDCGPASLSGGSVSPLSHSNRPGLGKRLLWYVPNRVMDLADIFRARVRLGPGLAANMRVTDSGAFYFGSYHSIYAGMPGPRNSSLVRYPVGIESLDGIIIGGVDATDDTAYGPEYGSTEVDFGLHVLFVGAEIGIDPMEFGDFLSGLLLIDLKQDDYPRVVDSGAKVSSGVSRGHSKERLHESDKPAEFSDMSERLDYLHTNVQQRANTQVRAFDERFAVDVANTKVVPDSRLRLGFYAEFIRGHSFDAAFKPDFDLDVSLPNLEEKIHLFIQSGRADELPGRGLSETENSGLTLGVRRALKEHAISLDAGLRASWLPRGYARITWHPEYEFIRWSFRPQQRLFADTRDNLGSLTTLSVDRWFGETSDLYAGSISSLKYSDNFSEMTWGQTFRLGCVTCFLEDDGPSIGYNRRNVATGGNVSFSVFGEESKVDTYRVTVGCRKPLYQNWIFWEVEPGLEWTEANDFDAAFRISLGIDMVFWGPIEP